MFLSLLFGLSFVFGNGCYTQCYRPEMSYVVSDAFRSLGSWGEHVCLLCIADSSQNVVFIVTEVNKTSPTAHLDLGYGFAITSKSEWFWLPAIPLNSCQSTPSCSKFYECRKSAVALLQLFIIKYMFSRAIQESSRIELLWHFLWLVPPFAQYLTIFSFYQLQELSVALPQINHSSVVTGRCAKSVQCLSTLSFTFL